MASTTSTTGAAKSPVGAMLDVFLFAPIGFALDARELVPKLAERGRNQVALLKVVGQFAVNKGRADADRILKTKPPAATAPPTPTPTSAPAPRAATRAATRSRTRAPAASATAPSVAQELPINNYDTLSASQIVPRLAGLRPEELARVRAYENSHRRRRTILGRIAQLQGRR
ncbi:MAG TPA: hypothetical protein VM282_14920 [Acidimicrobiales bacterium]|nr:hypothetical protein [Acidimicrobiales bacterium]